MSNDKDYNELLLVEIKRLDKGHDRVNDKLDAILISQNETVIQLTRNTDSLITHEKRTSLAEKRLEHVERHITKIDLILDFFKPTKIKIIVVLTILGLVTGGIDFSSTDSIIKQIISFIK